MIDLNKFKPIYFWDTSKEKWIAKLNLVWFLRSYVDHSRLERVQDRTIFEKKCKVIRVLGTKTFFAAPYENEIELLKG